MPSRHKKSKIGSVAVIGNHLPRKCGIATFTTDLCDALEIEVAADGKVSVVAMNDVPEGYRYPDRVRLELQANTRSDYLMAADFLNINQFDAVIVQHEYGIFGGPNGAHILWCLRELRMPVLTSLHTVLLEPSDAERAVMNELVQLSDRLIVLSERAKQMLMDVNGAPPEKIVHIPHGIPDVPFVDPSFHKDQFGIEGRKLILTFGLLSPNKGVEEMLRALPAVVSKWPEAVYIVLGATHPHVQRSMGEEYRQGLQRIVRDLKLQEHVIFQNRFVTLEELCQYIGAADVYVTPYLNAEQIVSGTLAYALGAGKAVVSTPYWYAEEMLADGRGRLVPFGDSEALAEQINDLFANEIERHAIRKRAYQFCRSMTWKRVARSYLDLAQEVLGERAETPRPLFVFAKNLPASGELPKPDLRHLRTMTDDTGMLQHAIFATPDRRHGYCTDDNARALIATLLHWNLFKDDRVLPLMQTYLAFMSAALNRETKRFRNFMSYDRKWLEDFGSDDSHGRAIWALGVAVANKPNDSVLMMATRLYAASLPSVLEFRSPRSWAFALVGIHAYLARFRGDAESRRVRAELAERLLGLFDEHSSDDWPWCEDTATYANARLSHAMLLSGQWVPDARMTEHGLRSLDWLLRVQSSESGNLSIIGNDGWLTRDGGRAHFDQQPLEAMGLIEACAEAYRITRDSCWIAEAYRCLEWFLGKNDVEAPLYDFKTGGCGDGLSPHGPNANQGAESTLSWLISLLTIHQLMAEEALQVEESEATVTMEENHTPEESKQP